MPWLVCRPCTYVDASSYFIYTRDLSKVWSISLYVYFSFPLAHDECLWHKMYNIFVWVLSEQVNDKCSWQRFDMKQKWRVWNVVECNRKKCLESFSIHCQESVNLSDLGNLLCFNESWKCIGKNWYHDFVEF